MMTGDNLWHCPMWASPWVPVPMAMKRARATLVEGALRGIVRALRLSRATMGNIKQNLFFAFIYNGLGITLAAGYCIPFSVSCSAP